LFSQLISVTYSGVFYFRLQTSVSQPRVRGLSGRLWVIPQALAANKFAVIPSHNNNCINFIPSTFLFEQQLKCT